MGTKQKERKVNARTKRLVEAGKDGAKGMFCVWIKQQNSLARFAAKKELEAKRAAGKTEGKKRTKKAPKAEV